MAGLLSAEDKVISLRQEWQAKDAAAKTEAQKRAAMIWYMDRLRDLEGPRNTGLAPGFEAMVPPVLPSAAAPVTTPALPPYDPLYQDRLPGMENYPRPQVMPPVTVTAQRPPTGLLAAAAPPPQAGTAAYAPPPPPPVQVQATPPVAPPPVTSPLGGYGLNPQGANVYGAGLSSNSAQDDYIAFLRWQAGMR
jgi:hypothetical protein